VLEVVHFFSSYVDYYVSIEHSPDYCRELERMAASQPHRSVKIFYMERNSSGFYIKNYFEIALQKQCTYNILMIRRYNSSNIQSQIVINIYSMVKISSNISVISNFDC